MPLVGLVDPDVAWAAGLFEGEGCITTYRGGTKPRLRLAMTDEDVVQRFADVVGVGRAVRRHSPSARALGRKPLWVWEVTSMPRCRAVLDQLGPALGERRTARMKEVLCLS